MKMPSFPNTVRGRLLFLAIIVEMVMLTLLVANSSRLLNNAMIKQINQQAEQLHPVLKAALTAPLAQQDFATVQAVIDESKKAGGVDYIAITDKNGRVTAQSGWQEGKPLPPPSPKFKLSLIGPDYKNRHDVVIPIIHQQQSFGALHFGIDLQQIIEARRSLLLQGIGIATIEIILSTIVLYFIIVWLTRHFQTLTLTSLRVANGDLTPTNVPEGDDDIGQLGRAFNTMSKAISERMEELTNARNELSDYSVKLAKLNLTLEERVIEEVAKNREKDQRLIQSEKMASVGQLAAGVAHEINNPMGFIVSNLSTLGKYTERLREYIQLCDSTIAHNPALDDSGAFSWKRAQLKIDYILKDTGLLIGESLEGAERVKLIVQGLKSFSRVDQIKLTQSDINECLDSTISVAWNEIKYVATLEKDYGELPLVKCHPQQLNQVFLNILVNAAQSIKEKGIIKVKTWHTGGDVFISISDTGGGILPEALSKIFDPFFSTKEVGKGTGLGLSISHEIIREHKGEISVSSTVGEGTTFTIRIPVSIEEN